MDQEKKSISNGNTVVSNHKMKLHVHVHQAESINPEKDQRRQFMVLMNGNKTVCQLKEEIARIYEMMYHQTCPSIEHIRDAQQSDILEGYALEDAFMNNEHIYAIISSHSHPLKRKQDTIEEDERPVKILKDKALRIIKIPMQLMDKENMKEEEEEEEEEHIKMLPFQKKDSNEQEKENPKQNDMNSKMNELKVVVSPNPKLKKQKRLKERQPSEDLVQLTRETKSKPNNVSHKKTP
jgi:hypothetical protein